MQRHNREWEVNVVSRKMEKIGDTLLRLATPDRTAKQLRKAAHKEHPTASKSEIARAAFWALINTVETHPEKALRLQDFALAERQAGSDDDLDS